MAFYPVLSTEGRYHCFWAGFLASGVYAPGSFPFARRTVALPNTTRYSGGAAQASNLIPF